MQHAASFSDHSLIRTGHLVYVLYGYCVQEMNINRRVLGYLEEWRLGGRELLNEVVFVSEIVSYSARMRSPYEHNVTNAIPGPAL